MREVEPQEESWDVKKIVIGVVMLAILVRSGIYIKDLVDKYNQPIVSEAQSSKVAGAQTVNTKEQIDTSSKEPSVSLPSVQQIKDSVTNQLDSLRQQVLTLNPGEIASSSPQVQKILNDLKTIQQYPQSQAHQICENICKSL